MKTINFVPVLIMLALGYIRLVGINLDQLMVTTTQNLNQELINQLEPLEEPTNRFLSIFK